jgi:hypothetical protein
LDFHFWDVRMFSGTFDGALEQFLVSGSSLISSFILTIIQRILGILDKLLIGLGNCVCTQANVLP